MLLVDPHPEGLTSAAPPGNVNPAGSSVERVRRGAVERDRSTGSVSPHQIEHLLEQLEQIFVPHPAADDDTLPWPGPQGSGDDNLHVVAAVQAEQASPNADAVLREPGYPHLDCVGYRLGIPRPGNPVRIEPDHEDLGYQGYRVHLPDLTSPSRSRACSEAAAWMTRRKR